MLAAKLTRVALSLAAAASLAAAPAALAADTGHDKMPSTYAALMKMKPTDVMHMIDKDAKGYVTREEFLKFHEALFENIDRDRDSRISTREFTDRG